LPPYATPFSNSSLDYRRSDARIVEHGFATSGGHGNFGASSSSRPSNRDVAPLEFYVWLPAGDFFQGVAFRNWVVVKGTAEVALGNDVRSVHENESIYIPIGSIHRLGDPGKMPLELIEVQVGSYLGEDDIVRLDDIYGRE
jgi:hypothetical protein